MIVPNFSAGADVASRFICNGIDGIDKFAGPPGLADKIIGGANGFVCNGIDGTNGYVCDGENGTDASTLDVVNNFIATNAVVDFI